ncbi:MAG: hypothetical protein JWN48_3533 [Myxococcaceae bacterium]|nr:hypothetical protein [Myxococcaceae bacterium]
MKIPPASRLTLALVASLTALACGDDAKPTCTSDQCVPGLDGGGSKDGSVDARGPVTSDGGTPTQTDAGVNAGPDGGDSQRDSGAADSGGPAVVACDPSTAPVIPALKLEPVAGITGLNRIVFAAQPKGSSDWYLVQQTGTVHLLSNGVLQPTPLLDLTSMVDTTIGNDDERGLLSIAFPPDFATSRKFYLGLTPTKATTGFPANSDTVIEFQLGAGSGAAPTRLRTIVQLPASETNHNGGTLVFGTDGLLYLGTGDGGAGCNDNAEAGQAQDVGKLFGKILRFDPKQPDAPYAAAGNPFASTPGGDPRVLHYGLRNPFRYSFDRATGDLYIGDVGQVSYEEADFAPAGAAGLNFGWPASEGNHAFTCGMGMNKQLRAGSVETKPIVEINRVGTNAPPPFGDYVSIMGGYVYRGSAIPQLQGVYLFGDYLGKRFGALRQCGSTTSPITPINKNKDPNAASEAFFGRPAQAPAFAALTAIVEDNAGELYFVANRNSLLKVVPGP